MAIIEIIEGTIRNFLNKWEFIDNNDNIYNEDVVQLIDETIGYSTEPGERFRITIEKI